MRNDQEENFIKNKMDKFQHRNKVRANKNNHVIRKNNMNKQQGWNFRVGKGIKSDLELEILQKIKKEKVLNWKILKKDHDQKKKVDNRNFEEFKKMNIERKMLLEQKKEIELEKLKQLAEDRANQKMKNRLNKDTGFDQLNNLS